MIRAIWAECLGIDVEEIAETSIFIDLGGDSMRAYQAAQAINARLGVAIRVSDLIGYGTLAEIAEDAELQMEAPTQTSHSDAPIPAKVAEPLNFSQRGQMHLIRLYETARPFTLIEGRCFENVADRDRLQGALTALINETDVFWMRVDEADGGLVQTLGPRQPFEVTLEDVRREADPDAAARQAVLGLADFEADLTGEVSFRAAIYQLADTRFEVFFVVSHVFFDGWSVELLFDALEDRLRGTPGVAPSRLPGAALEIAHLDGAAGMASAAYWQDVLAAPYEGALGRYLKPGDATSLEGSTLTRQIDRQTLGTLRRAAHEAGCSVYALVLSAIFVTLGRASGQTDLIIGTPAANREFLGQDATTALGCFANLLPIRMDLKGAQPMAGLYNAVQHRVGQAVAHQAYPYEWMVRDHGGAAGSALAPIFDVVVSHWSNAGKSAAARRSLHLPFAKYPLELIVLEEAEGLTLTARYSVELLDRLIVEGILDAVGHVLSKAGDTAEVPVENVPLMGAEAARALVARHDTTNVPWPEGATLVSLFDRQVAARPDAVAVTHDGTTWTYRDLAARAQRIADDLNAKGCRRGDRVAILMERGPVLIAALLGVLRAGCAYVPIDVAHPKSRQTYILTDSEARFLIRDGQGSGALYDLSHLTGPATGSAPGGAPRPDDLAYIIYTSGTTGQPKGVMIEHRNVVRLLYSDESPFAFTPDDVWTMFHSHCFDVSVFEVFGALTSGGTLVIVSNLVMRDPAAFRDLLEDQKVTVLRQTPTAFYNLLVEEETRADANLAVRHVLFAGEALAPARLRNWAEKYPDCALINLYGTTETTVDVTYHEVTPENIAANEGEIGGPLPTLSLYVLDGAQNPVPDGFAGEVVVGGAGVGRGYCNKPALTADRFITDPFVPGGRAYRTGDLARFTADGRLIYIGRTDQQVQVKGHRIEPEEVANVIRATPGVSEALVRALPDPDGGAYLAAYWIGGDVTEGDLRAHLAARVPPYMIPAFLTRIDQFPTTINGKVDLTRLPEPQRARIASGERTPPRSNKERTYFEVFAKVLGTRDFGVTDSFFDIGGDSLMAVKAAALSDRAFRVMDLYKRPSVEGLAGLSHDTDALLVDLIDRPGGQPSDTLVVATAFAGGSPADFLPVAEALNAAVPDWRFMGVAQPGQGGGRAARDVTDLASLAREVVDEIAALTPAPKRIFVMGYCVGVAFALAISTEMARRGIAPDGVAMSAIFPPGFDPGDPRADYWAATGDAELRATLGALGLGETAADLPDPLIADFRSDVRLYREYFFKAASQTTGPLDTPALLLFGDQDSETLDHGQRWRDWSRYLSVDRCTICADGGHYFLKSHPGFVADALCDWADTLAEGGALKTVG